MSMALNLFELLFLILILLPNFDYFLFPLSVVVKLRKNLEWKLKLLAMFGIKIWFDFWGTAWRGLTGTQLVNYIAVSTCIVSTNFLEEWNYNWQNHKIMKIPL